MEVEIASELIKSIFFDLAGSATTSATIDQPQAASRPHASEKSKSHSLQDSLFGTYTPKQNTPQNTRAQELEAIWEAKARSREKTSVKELER